MRLSKSIFAAVVCAFSINAHAECKDLQTTQAIVDYVCDYSLVSKTQCNMWREDMRQMEYNTAIIIDSFISWNENEAQLADLNASEY